MKIRLIKLMIISLIVIFIISTVVFAVQSIENISQSSSSSSGTTENINIVVQPTENVVSHNNELERYISKEQFEALYDKGYAVEDIEKAEELSLEFGMDPEEILKFRGIVKYSISKMQDGKETIQQSGKPWEEVRTELEIRRILKMEGEPEEKINESVKQFRNQLTSKKKVGESKALFDKAAVEKLYKDSAVVTEEEIEKCKKNGITDRNDITFAKKTAVKYRTTFEKVIEMKKKMKDWEKVTKELGGKK